MSKKKRLIPFHWLPASWGLRGQVRQEAEAAYYYQGPELEAELERIRIEHLPADDPERLRYELQAQFDRGEIEPKSFAKQMATINKEPWVDVLELVPSPDSPGQGYFELDWNEYWVELLESQGYGPNPRPEITVNEWFSDLARNVALERFDGIGDNTERLNGENPPTEHADVIYRSDLNTKDRK